MGYIRNFINIIMGISVVTWLGTSLINPLINLWGQPNENLLWVGSWSLVVTGSVSAINFFISENKLKTRIMNRLKKKPRTRVKTGCAACKKKK